MEQQWQDGTRTHVMTMQKSDAEMASEFTTLPLVTYTRTQPPAAHQQNA